MDDFVVPLRVGSIYSLRLSLDDFLCRETKEYQIALDPGQYQIQAVLEAKEAHYINLDTPGMRVMNIWTGILRSTPIAIDVKK